MRFHKERVVVSETFSSRLDCIKQCDIRGRKKKKNKLIALIK